MQWVDPRERSKFMVWPFAAKPQMRVRGLRATHMVVGSLPTTIIPLHNHHPPRRTSRLALLAQPHLGSCAGSVLG
jgi:hypothetical protein